MLLYILADVVNKIKLANILYFSEVVVFNNNFSKVNLYLLYKLGFISYFIILNYKYLKILLFYNFLKSCIRQISLVSKPSKKIYFKYRNLKKVVINNLNYNYFSFIFCSTSKGCLVDMECICLKVGGEPVLIVS